MKNLLTLLLGLALLAGCSSTGTKEENPKEHRTGSGGVERTEKQGAQAGGTAQQQEQPADPLTGREAFYKMFSNARLWAPDAQGVRAESQAMPNGAQHPGKAPAWRAEFASAGRKGIRPYTWNSAEAKGGESGVSHGSEDTFNPSNASTRPFDINFLKTDTDAAFAAAQKKGGEKITKADPSTPVMYQLEWQPRRNLLVWNVIYGNSMSDAKLRVAVDATTGKFIQVLK